MILGCPPVGKKALDSAAAYQMFMFLEWVPAAEPDFVDSHEKNILQDWSRSKQNLWTPKFYQTHVHLDSLRIN